MGFRHGAPDDRKGAFRTAISLLVALGAGMSVSFGATPPDHGSILITGATVIDGTGAAPVPGVTLLIRDGRFAEIGAARAAAPKGIRVIDASGKWIIPGLIDGVTMSSTRRDFLQASATTAAAITLGPLAGRAVAALISL
jgi:imidazolonepropionase-like amidohydrolase